MFLCVHRILTAVVPNVGSCCEGSNPYSNIYITKPYRCSVAIELAVLLRFAIFSTVILHLSKSNSVRPDLEL